MSIMSLVFNIMRTKPFMHGNAGSEPHREMHALSHESRAMHKGTSRTCRDQTTCYSYRS